MAEGPGLLERQTAASAAKVGARRSRANLDRAVPGSAKPPQVDQFLEDTLILSGKLAGSLTKREAEILKLILAGKTNKKIAQKLFRSERTIEYHRHRLMNKMGARTAADLVKRAITMGLV